MEKARFVELAEIKRVVKSDIGQIGHRLLRWIESASNLRDYDAACLACCCACSERSYLILDWLLLALLI